MAYYKSGGINVTSNSNVSINTASGSIASFNTNLSMPVLETKATINPVQNGTPWIDSNVINKEPYIKRAVVGTASRIGNHLYDKLVGGTVAFNQMLKNDSATPYTKYGITVTKVAGEAKVVVSGTSTYEAGGDSNLYFGAAPVPFVQGHKYLTDSNSDRFICYAYGAGNSSATKLSDVVMATRTANPGFSLRPITESSVEAGTVINEEVKFMCIDLTAMFGSTIADYIYSLEQATAGAGVAWFKALFPNDYYAYNAGELMSVKATAHVMKNASNTVIGNYTLDSNLVLNGLFKLDANNKLYADGDTYESSGLVTRKYDNYIFTGSESWSFYDAGDASFWYVSPLIVAGESGTDTICSNGFSFVMITNDTQIRVYLRDNPSLSSSTDMNTVFKNGDSITYKRKTLVSESADPFTNPQVCDENGTEEYTDNRAVAIPVGHETYQANICPISGHTEANLTRCGVNLMHVNSRVSQTTAQVIYTSDDNYIEMNGTKYGGTYADLSALTVTLPAGTYYLKAFEISGTATNAPSITAYNGSNLTANILNNERTLTLSVPTTFRFRFALWTDNSVYTNYKIGIAISTASISEYSEYTGNIYAIAFGQTVYGGVLDVTNGKLTSTYGPVSATASDLITGPVHTANNGWAFTISNKEAIYKRFGSVKSNINVPTYYDQATSSGFCFAISQLKPLFFLADSDTGLDGTATLAQVQSAFETFCNNYSPFAIYELDTPFDIDLTPVQINSLLGVNNVWHDDNGNTEVKYRKVNTQ